MKQRETSASINEIDLPVRYRVLKTDNGVVYEGLLGALPFTFSTNEDGFVFSDSLKDVGVRKAVIAAVLNSEDRLSED